MISGPSGIGKTTLTRQLEAHGFKNILMTYTRAPRTDEVNGVDVESISLSEYEKEAAKGAFFMDNRFLGNAYGLRKSAVEKIFSEGKVPMAAIYTPVVDQFLAEYPDSETVFMMPAALDLWQNRLSSREQHHEEFDKRFQGGLQEIELYLQTHRRFYKREFLVQGDDNKDFIETINSLYEGYGSVEGTYYRGKER